MNPSRTRPAALVRAAMLLAPWLALLLTATAVAETPVDADRWEQTLRAAEPLAALPRYSPAVSRLTADAADGEFDAHTLLQAALTASGVDDAARRKKYERQFQDWRAALRRSDRMQGDRGDQARALLAFLHGEVFTGGYRDRATPLRCVFERGEFNCVSSAVLFACLAREFGLPVEAVERPGHALIRLRTDSGWIDIETTCAGWFDVVDQPQRRHEMVRRVTGFDPSQSSFRRLLSDVQLVAIIDYNRGVEQLAREQYAEAVRSNLRALRLDPANSMAHGNLLATLNNWALALGAAGEYRQALSLLAAGVRIAPGHENFLSNEIHIHQNWVEALLTAGDWRTALRAVDAAAKLRPEESYYRIARWNVLERQGEAFIRQAGATSLVAMFDEARRRYPSAPEVEQIELGVWNRAALARLEAGDYERAVALIDFGLLRLPGAEILENNRRAILARWTRHSPEAAEVGLTAGDL